MQLTCENVPLLPDRQAWTSISLGHRRLLLLLETWKYFSFLYLDSRSVNINITKIFIFMWIPTCRVEIDICIRTSSLSTSIPHCGWIRLISLHNAIPDFSKKFNSSTSCKLEDFLFLLLSSSLSSIIYNLKKVISFPVQSWNIPIRSMFWLPSLCLCLGRICLSFSPLETGAPSCPRTASRCGPPPRLSGSPSWSRVAPGPRWSPGSPPWRRWAVAAVSCRWIPSCPAPCPRILQHQDDLPNLTTPY